MKPLRLTLATLLVAVSLGLPSTSRSAGPAESSHPPRCRQCGWPLVGLSIATDPVLRASRHAKGCSAGSLASAQTAQATPQTDAAAQNIILGELFGFPTCRPAKSQAGPPRQSVPGAVGADGLPIASEGAAPGEAPVPGATTPPVAATDANTGSRRLGRDATSGNGGLTMFGDLVPLQPIHIRAIPGGGGGIGLGARGVAPPTFVRGFKIADNQTPIPTDRVYYNFNFFDNVWQKVNEREKNGINRVQIYRQLLGFEKTFWDGYASIGVRLPINTITADSATGGQAVPTKTAINNFSVYTKFLFYSNQETKTYASWGLAATIPTGPQNFGGANYVRNYNNVELQPYIGFQKSWDRLYFLAFEAVNVPLNTHDVTTIYNDYALGYFVYRTDDKTRIIQAIAPTLETHINIPLNHRNVYNLKDKAGTADIVDLTYGLNVYFQKKTQLGIGLVSPISGPRPFSLEAMAFLNFYF